MSIFSIFSSQGAIKFGIDLADMFSKKYPPSLAAKGLDKLSVERTTRILENIYAVAQNHQSLAKYGIYKKARLCHAFKWRLIELGFSRTLVDLATEGLVVYLNKKTSG